MANDELASTSGADKGSLVSYHKDEEKENTCSSRGQTISSSPSLVCEPSEDLVIEEELDAGVVPSIDVVMAEHNDSELQIDVTSTPRDGLPPLSAAPSLSQSLMTSMQSHVTVSPLESQIKFSAPESVNVPSNLSQPTKSFKFHDNTFETMKALEQIQGQFKQSQCVQSTEKPDLSLRSSPSNSSTSTSVNNSPKVDTPVVPRKRGRPKGSTTKNRKIKNIGGLNLWGPKAAKNKLSTLEMLALSAQRQHAQQQQQQQSDSQAMLNLLMQQQLQQQLLGMGSNQDTMQLLMALGPSVQQAYVEQQQQQVLLAQQQQLLAQSEQKIANIQPNQLLEMQLQHEISNLEKILAAHAAEQKLITASKAPQTMDLGMYQLNNLAGQNPGQGGLGTVSAAKVLKSSVADQFQNSVVSDSLQKEAQQSALLRETMMKLQGHSLQNSGSRTSPNGIFSTAGSGVPQSVMSTAQTSVMGYSPSFSTSWSSAGSLDYPAAQTISSPLIPPSFSPQKISPKQQGHNDATEDVTRQFLELIKSLGSDPAQTEQLLQLLAGQISANGSVPSTSSSPAAVQTPYSQSSVLGSPPPLQPAQQPSITSPLKADALNKMSDLEQLISSLKSPTQQMATQPAFFAPKIKNAVQLEHLLPKPRGRPPGSSNGSSPAAMKQHEGKRHRGRPRKYPEHFYNVVNGKMKYPGAKERRMFFPFDEAKYSSSTPTPSMAQINQSAQQTTTKTSSSPEQPNTSSGATTVVPSPLQPAEQQTLPTPPPKKRGRPKGSKNKPCLITSPQQLLDMRSQFPENSPVWAGMPDCKQAQIAAVLSGLNHKLFRQNPSFTV